MVRNVQFKLTQTCPKLRRNELTFSVVGLGFGLMSGVFSMVNVLADSYGPGTLGNLSISIHSDLWLREKRFSGWEGEPTDFFMYSAAWVNAMILANTFWGIITFVGYSRKGREWPDLVKSWHQILSCLVREISLNLVTLHKGLAYCWVAYVWAAHLVVSCLVSKKRVRHVVE